MTTPLTLLEVDDFANSIIVDWSTTGLRRGSAFGSRTNEFTFAALPGQIVTIDVDGPTLRFDRNVPGSKLGFSSRDPMLLGINDSNQMPIHIQFKDPVEALGAHVSAVGGAIGSIYHAELLVRLSGDPTRKWWPINSPFKLSERNGSAPFLGIKVKPGTPRISEIYFDVMPDTNAQREPFQVAINVLRFFA
jgi:hypothetical protein